MTKKDVLKKVRNIGLTMLGLLVLVGVGGFAYTWYMGQQVAVNAQAFAQPVEAPKQDKVVPVKVSQTGAIGASVSMLTSPVTPGSNASISVRTNPQANCLVVVEYAGKQSKDSGLTEKKADEYGVVSWAWTVEPSAPIGTWPVTVTCANQKNSAVVRGDLQIVRTIEE